MSYIPTIVWGGSQLAAVLLSRDILGKALTFGGTLLYRRLSDEPESPDLSDIDARLARVATLLHGALGCPEDDSWEEIDGWEIARSQPGSLHRHAHLFRDAHPRDMAAWQLKETVQEVGAALEPGRRRDPARLKELLCTMHARTEALLAAWHTAADCAAEGGANFYRRRSQSVS